MGILMTKFTFTANATTCTKLHREKKNIKGKLLLENSYSRRQQNLYTHNLSTFDFNKTKTFSISPSMTHTCLHFSYLNLIHLL